MPKLKGLLDSANAKLAGLLGDFPQGFNAGAVAGFPGWAGDMAYLADTARLALTGADSQAAPEDYVGTTDYIAKQAGYPVPQTLSGQLGAAVGGLMSPGPGDLAKFAPVLSAIPFWHGSPHKFDRFDLAHMGKGEGAQAYGWGAYGAESKDVAKQYADALQTWKTTINGEPLTPDRPEFSAGMSIAAQGYNKALKDAEDALASGFVDPVAAARQVETIKALKGAKIEAVPESNMYRGEYRWPDPQKEAATPLTGEDLLQWDRPLSEQPEGVRKALAEASEVRVRPFGSRASDGSEFADVEVKLPGQPWASAGAYLLDEATKVAADKQAVIDSLPFRGDSLYNMLARAQGGDDEASRFLAEAGIPGIRYLDGQSRPYMDATTRVVEDGGKWFGEVRNPDTSTHYSGTQLSDYFDTKAEAEAWVKKTLGEPTHNLVMFSDKGIKLLERNGTPIEDFAARRAGKAKPYREAMRVLYRGSNDSGESIKGGIAEGALFAAANEKVAQSYAGTGGNVERIGVKPDAKILVEGSPEYATLTGRRRGKLINTMRKGENLKTAADDVARLAREAGYDAVEFTSMEDMGIAIFNPDKFIRGLTE